MRNAQHRQVVIGAARTIFAPVLLDNFIRCCVNSVCITEGIYAESGQLAIGVRSVF